MHFVLVKCRAQIRSMGNQFRVCYVMSCHFHCHCHFHFHWSHRINVLGVTKPFLCSLPYCTFRRSFKEKCPLSGAKTRVQYINPHTFLLHYVLLCFYYVASGAYCSGSEFKYPKNECSIMLEICPTPNSNLNLHDNVDKCKTNIKTHLLMQPCYLNFRIC